MHYQLFDYSTSGTDDELSDTMMPISTHQTLLDEPDVPDEQNPEPEVQDPVSDASFIECLPQFSDHEPACAPSQQLST